VVRDRGNESGCQEQLHQQGSWLCWASTSSLLCSSFSGMLWWWGKGGAVGLCGTLLLAGSGKCWSSMCGSFQATVKCDATILGQGGRFAPQRASAPRIYFLRAYEQKPGISDLTTVSRADGNWSGVVRGVIDGSRALWSCQGRGGEGLDCIFKFLVKVFLAKVEDYFVFSVLIRFFYVKLPAD
jgi:hypothetical protein